MKLNGTAALIKNASVNFGAPQVIWGCSETDPFNEGDFRTTVGDAY